MRDDTVSAGCSYRVRSRAWSHPRTGLAALCAVVAFGLAACGGSGSPRVAGLGQHTGDDKGGATATTTASGGNPTQLLDAWATCMRAHGDPNQADPTIDANEDIHINWDPAIPGGYDGTQKGGQGNVGPGQFCRNDLNDAQSALEGGQAQQSPSQAQLLNVAQCMRANGIPNFPDPVNGTLSFNVGAGGDLNPHNPTFQAASKLCRERTGVNLPGTGGPPPPGTIELNGGSPFTPSPAGGVTNG